MPRHPQHPRAVIALLALTAVWGSTFVVLQSSLALISPWLMMALRFGSAGLLLAALRPAAVPGALALIVPTLPLSLSMFAGFSLQLFGLADTTPARSAFLTSLSVLLVPAIEWLMTRSRPDRRMLMAVALATAGVAVLFHPIGLEWRRGDTLTLLCAVAFAYYFVDLGTHSRRHGLFELVISQFLTLATLAAGSMLVFETVRFDSRPSTWLALVYLSLVCTAATFLMMTWAQARVRPVEAGIIYTLEPVVAAIFSIALGREPFGVQVVAGGLFILGAMLVASTAPAQAPAPNPRCTPDAQPTDD